MAKTPNHNYNVPTEGTQNWHEPLNDNFDALETDVEIRDSGGPDGSYEPAESAKYLDTNSGDVYLGDGTDWTRIGTLGRGDGDTTTAGRYLADDDGVRDFTGPAEWENDGDTTTNEASGTEATVGGGRNNVASGDWATVGAGLFNKASGGNTTIGGGSSNVASDGNATVGGGADNVASRAFATVAGGWDNEASNPRTTVAGGVGNEASGDNATVSGGQSNQSSANFATVGGGQDNVASGTEATVGGGLGNVANSETATVGGGLGNEASGLDATVGGGGSNVANGFAATVPGGEDNVASGNYSVAAGRNATASHDGAIVFGDSTEEKVESQNEDEARFQMEIVAEAGVDEQSARAAKTNINPVDSQRILDGLQRLDVAQWEYTDGEGNGKGRTHIGPMAEEFHDAFEIGDEKTINSIDRGGVAYAAIQALAQQLKTKQTHADEQADRIENLEETVAMLQEQLDVVVDAMSDN